MVRPGCAGQGQSRVVNWSDGYYLSGVRGMLSTDIHFSAPHPAFFAPNCSAFLGWCFLQSPASMGVSSCLWLSLQQSSFTWLAL